MHNRQRSHDSKYLNPIPSSYHPESIFRNTKYLNFKIKVVTVSFALLSLRRHQNADVSSSKPNSSLLHGSHEFRSTWCTRPAVLDLGNDCCNEYKPRLSMPLRRFEAWLIQQEKVITDYFSCLLKQQVSEYSLDALTIGLSTVAMAESRTRGEQNER
ncbi:hypothetical protein AB6E04_10335 [Vibrio amylolyticus]|uniref:hypothetical protein n=1 Tax=Vibrio amylolyticus TaxID=2847292 RepID=UPI00105573BA